MVDPIASKAALKPLESLTEQGGGDAAKTTESKFDKVRARLQEEQAGKIDLPPEIKQVSMQQKRTLETGLSNRMAKSPNASVQQIFGPDMKKASEGIKNLANRVNALPKAEAFDPIRNRLASIDSQYQSAGKLLSTLGDKSNPADYMKVQMQMYQLSENLQLMSKVVEQVTSGVKSILQTQV